MKKINFVMGIHNHQPVGNFDFVFEDAYQKSYLPFLEILEKHPKIKMAQHYTGILFQWIENNHPEFFPRLRKMVQNGQIEMMTGGFYEPILPIIPEQDRIEQIQKLSKFVKKQTGYNPIGMWLAERVWEPDLPGSLYKAGIKYTVLDDSHFKYSGLQDPDLYGYYVTEHNGSPLNLFPICEKLRYTMPFQPPEETLEFLRSIAATDGQNLVVFADDGEKFGVWPETFEHCYENGWLNDFFTLIEDNLDWINLITFEQALEQINPFGKVYLQTASYREMMEWALPSHVIHDYEDFEKWLEEKAQSFNYKHFVRGGFWRNFLAKYPESNNLHKRMLWQKMRFDAELSDSKSRKAGKIKDHIFAGQCNCAYWHGVFGGLYLPHLRSAIYENLIQADNDNDALVKTSEEKKQGWVKVQSMDFDVDGNDEVIVSTDRMNLFFKPNAGASLFELDVKAKNFNLIDTMTRREEGYHRKLFQIMEKSAKQDVSSIHDIVKVKEEGLDKYLNYDWYRRSSLLDHFLHPQTTLERFSGAHYGEQGDFVNQPYSFRDTVKKNVHYLNFQRDGHVWCGDDFVPVSLSKDIIISPLSDELEINYIIQNSGNIDIELWFGTEFAYSLLAGNAPDRFYQIDNMCLQERNLASLGSIPNINNINLLDEWLGLHIRLEFDQETTVWRFPIETISMSEAGFERIYQCSVVFPNWKFKLDAGKSWKTSIKHKIIL